MKATASGYKDDNFGKYIIMIDTFKLTLSFTWLKAATPL